MAKLIAQSGHSLDLPQRRVTLGESSACDIPLAPGLGLASRHFELEPDQDGNYVVRDLSGGAGIKVNGQPVQVHVLQHGNVIMAGDLSLGFWDADHPSLKGAETPFLTGSRSNELQPATPPSPEPEPFRPMPVIPLPPPNAVAPERAAEAEAALHPENNLAAAAALPGLPASEGPPPAWINPMATAAAAQTSTGAAAGNAPAPPKEQRRGKRQSVWSQNSRKMSSRRMMKVAALLALAGGGVYAARTEPAQKVLAPLWSKVTAWINSPRPSPPKSPPATVATGTGNSVVVAADPGNSVTPKTNHNDLVKRMLTERTLSLFQADLTQLVPFYNAAAGERSLPPQREMTEAFRKHYGILLDGFDRLTCLRGSGKDEFVFVLSSSTRVNIESVLGIPPPAARTSTAAKKGIRIYPVKPTGRVYGVAQIDPFTVILGSQSWIDSSLNGSSGPSLREAANMFPDTACRNPGALIMVERIVPPTDSSAPSAFETAVSNLFFKGKGESRLTLTRNPEVKESVFVQQSSAALKEQAAALMQAVKVSEALTAAPGGQTDKGQTTDSGELINTTEASILIPDGDALLREAIDSVAYTFMSQSPSVELILAAQKAVMNFNQARLKQAPEAVAVTSVAEALELLQSGIAIKGQDRVYQIDRLEPHQADDIVHLLAMEGQAGLIFRPNTDQLTGALLDLAVKARDYRNAELLISLWTAAKFTGSESADVNAAVRKVMDWSGGEGSRQRISVGLPSLTAAEYKNAVALLSVQSGQLTWKPGEEGYRTWLRRISPNPKADAKRIAGAYDTAIKAGAIPQGKVECLADAVRLIHSSTRTGASPGSNLLSSTALTVDELRAAARYLRYDRGALKVVEK